MFVIEQENAPKIHFDIVTLIYNASKLAADRISAQLYQEQAA